jgi:hypothetical protein
MGQQRQIGAPIIVAKEHRQPPIFPLRHVLRNLRDDNASKPSHTPTIGTATDNVN